MMLMMLQRILGLIALNSITAVLAFTRITTTPYDSSIHNTAFVPSIVHRAFQKPPLRRHGKQEPFGRCPTRLHKTTTSMSFEEALPEGVRGPSHNQQQQQQHDASFDLTTALFCGGLAFDAYVEPPSNSSRWERGSSGTNVAFCSPSYTRHLYRGLLEVTVHKCVGLPEDESPVERVLTGNGIDAAVLVAALEGSWKEDVDMLENEQYHAGVVDLTGAAHVGRSSTAWAHVDEQQSKVAARQRGKALPYHIPSSWGKEAQAVWPDAESFYLYLQDPASVRLVFTVVDDDKLGGGTAIGSTHKRLSDLIPQARLTTSQVLDEYKRELVAQFEKSGMESLDQLNETFQIQLGAKSWSGILKLTSKPRKKDKNSQILAGAAAGAYVAGPVGAAAGALIGSFYEGQVKGYIELRLRYLPIPQVDVPRRTYQVLGGMPGINWGQLYDLYSSKHQRSPSSSPMTDLEHCFFVNHDKTGATCAVYRSLEQKLIVVSFRGTCAPIDLVTDVSIIQETWVDGDEKGDDVPQVHAGFRSSLNSISRRLKELILATVAPGESFSHYDLLITGHSLGGALATLFSADIGEYGIDAGRALPQKQESEPWWKSIASTLMGQQAKRDKAARPPRPKSLRLYSFGSPRVGNQAFARLFDNLLDQGHIDQAYRIVNGEDVVARLPRTVSALGLAGVVYEHCGPTVLLTQPEAATELDSPPLIWIEGESDDRRCPVRDGDALTSPTAEGSLLAELFADDTETQTDGSESQSMLSWSKLTSAASKLSKRVRTLTASDIASVLGIERKFTERELKMFQALMQGRALAHHMEDEYYKGMGGASGFRALVGEVIAALEVYAE